MAAALDTVIVSPLIDQFWLFYSEIMRLKRAIDDQRQAAGLAVVARATAAEAPAEPAPAEPDKGEVPALFADGGIDAHLVATTLQRMLGQFAVAAMRQGGDFAGDLYNEALYVMAALADEVFLHDVNWPEKQAYRSVLVESLMFKSHVAGEQVFAHLDRLLDTRDPLHGELATIYLLALSLGFRGKYRRGGDPGRLAHYRRRLFQFIMHRSADLNSEALRLSVSAYDHTLREGGGLRLRPLRKWLMGLAAALLLVLVASHGIWMYHTAGVQSALDSVFAIAAGIRR